MANTYTQPAVQPAKPDFNDILDVLNPNLTPVEKTYGVVTLPLQPVLHPFKTIKGVMETYTKLSTIPLAVYSGNLDRVKGIITGTDQFSGKDVVEQFTGPSTGTVHGIFSSIAGFGLDVVSDPIGGSFRISDEMTHAVGSLTIQAAAPGLPQALNLVGAKEWTARWFGTGLNFGENRDLLFRPKDSASDIILNDNIPAELKEQYHSEVQLRNATSAAAKEQVLSLNPESASEPIQIRMPLSEGSDGIYINDIDKYQTGDNLFTGTPNGSVQDVANRAELKRIGDTQKQLVDYNARVERQVSAMTPEGNEELAKVDEWINTQVATKVKQLTELGLPVKTDEIYNQVVSDLQKQASYSNETQDLVHSFGADLDIPLDALFRYIKTDEIKNVKQMAFKHIAPKTMKYISKGEHSGKYLIELDPSEHFVLTDSGTVPFSVWKKDPGKYNSRYDETHDLFAKHLSDSEFTYTITPNNLLSAIESYGNPAFGGFGDATTLSYMPLKPADIKAQLKSLWARVAAGRGWDGIMNEINHLTESLPNAKKEWAHYRELTKGATGIKPKPSQDLIDFTTWLGNSNLPVEQWQEDYDRLLPKFGGLGSNPTVQQVEEWSKLNPGIIDFDQIKGEFSRKVLRGQIFEYLKKQKQLQAAKEVMVGKNESESLLQKGLDSDYLDIVYDVQDDTIDDISEMVLLNIDRFDFRKVLLTDQLDLPKYESTVDHSAIKVHTMIDTMVDRGFIERIPSAENTKYDTYRVVKNFNVPKGVNPALRNRILIDPQQVEAFSQGLLNHGLFEETRLKDPELHNAIMDFFRSYYIEPNANLSSTDRMHKAIKRLTTLFKERAVAIKNENAQAFGVTEGATYDELYHTENLEDELTDSDFQAFGMVDPLSDAVATLFQDISSSYTKSSIRPLLSWVDQVAPSWMHESVLEDVPGKENRTRVAISDGMKTFFKYESFKEGKEILVNTKSWNANRWESAVTATDTAAWKFAKEFPNVPKISYGEQYKIHANVLAKFTGTAKYDDAVENMKKFVKESTYLDERLDDRDIESALDGLFKDGNTPNIYDVWNRLRAEINKKHMFDLPKQKVITKQLEVAMLEGLYPQPKDLLMYRSDIYSGYSAYYKGYAFGPVTTGSVEETARQMVEHTIPADPAELPVEAPVLPTPAPTIPQIQLFNFDSVGAMISNETKMINVTTTPLTPEVTDEVMESFEQVETASEFSVIQNQVNDSVQREVGMELKYLSAEQHKQMMDLKHGIAKHNAINEVKAVETSVAKWCVGKSGSNAEGLKLYTKLRNAAINEMYVGQNEVIKGSNLAVELVNRNNTLMFHMEHQPKGSVNKMVQLAERLNTEIGADGLFKVEHLKRPNHGWVRMHIDDAVLRDNPAAVDQYKDWLKANKTGTAGYEDIIFHTGTESKLKAFKGEELAKVKLLMDTITHANTQMNSFYKFAGLGDQVSMTPDRFFPHAQTFINGADIIGTENKGLITDQNVTFADTMRREVGLTGTLSSTAYGRSIMGNPFNTKLFMKVNDEVKELPLFTKHIGKAYQSMFSSAFADHTNLRLARELMLNERYKLSNIELVHYDQGIIATHDITVPVYKGDQFVGVKTYAPTEANLVKYNAAGYLTDRMVSSELRAMLKYENIVAKSPAYGWLMKNIITPFKSGVLLNLGFPIGNGGDMYYKSLMSIPFDKWPEYHKNLASAPAIIKSYSDHLQNYALVQQAAKGGLMDVSYLEYLKDMIRWTETGEKAKWMSKAADHIESRQALINKGVNVQSDLYKALHYEIYRALPVATTNQQEVINQIAELKRKYKDENFRAYIKGLLDSPVGRVLNKISRDNPVAKRFAEFNEDLENMMRFTHFATVTGGTSPEAVKAIMNNPEQLWHASASIKDAHMHFSEYPGNAVWLSSIFPFWQFPLKNAIWWTRFIGKHPELAGQVHKFKRDMWGTDDDSFWSQMGGVPINNSMVLRGVPGLGSYSQFGMGVSDPTNLIGNRMNPIIRPFFSTNGQKYRSYNPADRNPKSDNLIAAWLHGMNPLEGNIQWGLNLTGSHDPLFAKLMPSVFRAQQQDGAQ